MRSCSASRFTRAGRRTQPDKRGTAREFQPEDLGKLSCYVEALDRDVKRPPERPLIGVLLSAARYNGIVERAVARTASPTLAAEYPTALPSRALLRRKLLESYGKLKPADPEGKGRGK